MLNFRRILFPVDLSPQCQEAAPFVKAAATRFGAEVTLLHVMEIPAYWYGTMGAESFAAVVDMPTLIEQRKQQFDKFLPDAFGSVKVERVMDQGDPAYSIREFVESRHADLVMMPTHGYGPFRSLLIGSVAAKVLHDVKCPVWTSVHAEKQASHPDEVRSMLCGIDLTEESRPLLQWAASLAEMYGATLRLVHAVAGGSFTPEQHFDTELDGFLMNMARDEIAKLQKAVGTDFELCLAKGDVADVTRDAAKHHNADLVIIGRGLIQHPLGRFRTHAYSIIRQAPCPVLSV